MALSVHQYYLYHNWSLFQDICEKVTKYYKCMKGEEESSPEELLKIKTDAVNLAAMCYCQFHGNNTTPSRVDPSSIRCMTRLLDPTSRKPLADIYKDLQWLERKYLEEQAGNGGSGGGEVQSSSGTTTIEGVREAIFRNFGKLLKITS